MGVFFGCLDTYQVDAGEVPERVQVALEAEPAQCCGDAATCQRARRVQREFIICNNGNYR